MATIASLTLKRALRMHGPVGVVLQEVRREPLKRIGWPLDAQLGQSLCQNGDKTALAFQIQLCLSWRHWGGRRHYLPNIPCACVSSGFWRKEERGGCCASLSSSGRSNLLELFAQQNK